MDQLHFFIDAALYDIATDSPKVQKISVASSLDERALLVAEIDLRTLKMPCFLRAGEEVIVVGGEMKGAKGKVETVTSKNDVVVLFTDVPGAPICVELELNRVRRDTIRVIQSR